MSGGYLVLLLPANGEMMKPPVRHGNKTLEEVTESSVGYAMTLCGNYGPYIDVVIINKQTREAVKDMRIAR